MRMDVFFGGDLLTSSFFGVPTGVCDSGKSGPLLKWKTAGVVMYNTGSRIFACILLVTIKRMSLSLHSLVSSLALSCVFGFLVQARPDTCACFTVRRRQWSLALVH